MASIQEYLDLIKNAIYGKDVRQAIHDGIQQCYYDGRAGATDLEARQRLEADEANITSLTSRMSTAEGDIDTLDARVDQIVAPSGEAPSAAEVADGRIVDGITYDLIGDAIRAVNTNLKSALDAEIIQQLFKGGLTTTYFWNCWTATVYKESNSNYFCIEFDIPSGTEYITTNHSWAENSFSAFVNDSYGKIELIKNCRQSGSGYVYSIPTGTTKACVSIPNDDGLAQEQTRGIVFLVGTADITSVTKADYPYDGLKTYYADLLHLHSGGTVADFKSDFENSGFVIRKNLVTELNEGEYCESWNIGDSVTTSSNAQYAYGYADVEGLEKITINLPHVSDSFSFFTDSLRKKVSTLASCQVGTSRVYSVPESAKYVYISSGYDAEWGEYGLVIFSGTDDITTNTVSAEVYPYNTTVIFADDLELSNGNTLIESVNSSRIYHVEKDGSGDYTSLVECIQEAVKYMDSVVYVGAGTWDIVSEFGSTYMENVSSNKSTWGLVLKNRIHIIGTPQTVIEAKYTGSHSATTEYFSAFNAGTLGFTLENLRIESDNIRYSVHDDRGSDSFNEHYVNRYINCSMKHTNGMYSDCIGGGLGINGTIEIRDCYFEGDAGNARLVYYHGNNYGGEENAQCKITVMGNYFANIGTFGLTKYGDSTKVSEAYVSNNSVGSPLFINSGSYAPNDNMRMIAWNNEIRG